MKVYAVRNKNSKHSFKLFHNPLAANHGDFRKFSLMCHKMTVSLWDFIYKMSTSNEKLHEFIKKRSKETND